jgi:hypothetical protein
MLPTPRTGPRLAAGIGLASAVIALPALVLAAPAASHSAGSHSHAVGIAAVRPCRAASIRVWYGLPAGLATSHAYYQFQFSNIGHSTCSLSGYPGVSALNDRVGAGVPRYSMR